jgi:hypothetical protein
MEPQWQQQPNITNSNKNNHSLAITSATGITLSTATTTSIAITTTTAITTNTAVTVIYDIKEHQKQERWRSYSNNDSTWTTKLRLHSSTLAAEQGHESHSSNNNQTSIVAATKIKE